MPNLPFAQYDANGIAVLDPTEITRRFPGWTTEDSFLSTITQSPAGADLPTQVSFGAAHTTPNGLMSVDAAGTVTILKGGPFAGKTRFRMSRTGALGVSHLLMWVEVSLNGGATWTVIGNSTMFPLNNPTETKVFFDFSLGNFPKGTKLRQMFARSSTGDNSGDLVSFTPSAALQAAGVPIVPSAQVTWYRLIDFPYAP